MKNLNLRRATTFHAVAREGGVAAAARALNKSPSAVHHDIAQFQKEVGATLLERAGRRLTLTPEGRVLFETIGRAIDDIARVRSRIAAGAEAAAPLRVACVSGFGRYRLAPRLLAAAGPHRPVELIFGAHETVLAALVSGRADYGVTYREVWATPVRSQRIAEEELALIASKTASLPKGFEALEHAPFISYDEYEYVFARWFDAAFARQPAPLRILDHMSEMEEAIESCAAGRGVTIVPADAQKTGPWRDRTRIIRRGGKRCVNALYLLGVGAALDRADAALIVNAAR